MSNPSSDRPAQSGSSRGLMPLLLLLLLAGAAVAGYVYFLKPPPDAPAGAGPVAAGGDVPKYTAPENFDLTTYSEDLAKQIAAEASDEDPFKRERALDSMISISFYHRDKWPREQRLAMITAGVKTDDPAIRTKVLELLCQWEIMVELFDNDEQRAAYLKEIEPNLNAEARRHIKETVIAYLSPGATEYLQAEAKKNEGVARRPNMGPPSIEEAPKITPKSEEPKAEEPKAEEPKAEEPKAEEPKAEEPKAEEPKKEGGA